MSEEEVEGEGEGCRRHHRRHHHRRHHHRRHHHHLTAEVQESKKSMFDPDTLE
jgi:hypothetical protein